MHLKKITLTNFRCFRNLSMDFEPQLTVLTATNGHGKTTILEAVKYALHVIVGRFPTMSTQKPADGNISAFIDASGEERRERYLRIMATADLGGGADWSWGIHVANKNLPKDEKLAFDSGDLKLVHKYVDELAQDRFNGGDKVLPVIAYYDTQRAVTTKVQRRRGFRTRLEYYEGYKGCLDAGLSFKAMLEWIECFEKKEHDEWKKSNSMAYSSLENQVIQTALRILIPELSNLRTELGPYRLVVDAEIDGVKTACRVDEYLSDGYRIVLMMVLDLISRIIKLNPKSFKSPQEALNCPGVALIDEIDLHLHPEWQQRVLPSLLNVFPRIQFIVTTHSPQVVSSVDAQCVRKINVKTEVTSVRSEPENIQQVTRPAINTQGAKAGQILSSVFDTSERAPSADLTRDIREFREMLANGNWDSEEGEALWEKLSAAMQTDPELPSLKVERMFKEYDREKGHEANPQA